MNKEITSIVKKTVKVGADVCVAAGAVALMTSGAALKALTEGGKYLKDTVKKIIGEEPKEAAPAEEAPVEELPVEEEAESPVAEAVAKDADFENAGSQDA